MGFSPSIEDAAELDATYEFLRTMVDLSYLEEREEKARNGFSHVKKRWESRVSKNFTSFNTEVEGNFSNLNSFPLLRKKRQEGLKGKPTQGNNIDMRRVIHGTSMLDPAEKKIVTFLTNIARSSFVEQDSRIREKSMTKHQNIPRRSKGLHGNLRTIQQPRKMN